MRYTRGRRLGVKIVKTLELNGQFFFSYFCNNVKHTKKLPNPEDTGLPFNAETTIYNADEPWLWPYLPTMGVHPLTASSPLG